MYLRFFASVCPISWMSDWNTRLSFHLPIMCFLYCVKVPGLFSISDLDSVSSGPRDSFNLETRMEE